MPLDAQPGARLERADPDPFPARNEAPRRGNWGVVYTHSQAERWANDNLRRSGFTTYLPLAITRRRDRAIPSLYHRVEVPLFPRYLFVQHDNPNLWRPIRETPGVAAVLQCGNQMQYASAGSVEALRAAEAQRATDPPPNAQWAPGAAVSLSQGPFRNHPAVVLSVTRDAAHLAVLMFGALRQVRAPLEWLTARDSLK